MRESRAWMPVCAAIAAIASAAPVNAQNLVPRPTLEIPDGTGEAFRSLWLEGQRLQTRAVALEESINIQRAECTAIAENNTKKVAECRRWRADLKAEFDEHKSALADYDSRRMALWDKCKTAWTLKQITPPAPDGVVNAEGCALQFGIYDPATKPSPREAGLITKEPPPPVLPVNFSPIPRKEVMSLGPQVAKMVFEGLDGSFGDLRNAEKTLSNIARRSATPNYPAEQAASFLTGMRYAAEAIGASPRPPTQADLNRFFLPKDTLNSAILAGNFVPEPISRPDEPSTAAMFHNRNRLAEDALRAENGDVNRAIQRLEKPALEQPISATHLALRTLQGVHVYMSILNAK